MRKRKWVVAGVAVVAIGVGACLFSQPSRGTLEYHKREYVKAFKGGTLGTILKSGPRVLRDAYLRHRQQRMDFHREALLELGFLERRVFVLSNTVPDLNMFAAVFINSDPAFGAARSCAISGKSVVVVVPADEMPGWEKAVREYDVPEK
jgi:hypothetical protein